MFFHNQTTPPPVEPPPSAPSRPGMEFYGDPIVQSGEYAANALPENLVTLISQLDLTTLPVGTDVKMFLAQIQQETAAQVQAKATDVRNQPIEKITSLSQLTAEQRALISSFVGNNYKPKQEAPPPPDGKRRFGSIEELTNHVHTKLAALNAVDAMDAAEAVQRQEEYEEEEEAPVVKPMFLPESSAVETTAPTVDRPRRKKSKRANITKCPHCDLSLDVDPVGVTDEQRQAFMIAVLHNTPYTETLNVFGGAVQIKFVSLTNAQMDYLNSLTETVGASQTVSNTDKYNFYLRSMLSMVVSEVIVGEKKYVYAAFEPNSDVQGGINKVLARYNDIAGKISGGEIMNMLCAEVLKFNFRCRTMVGMGLNSDFWKPTQS